MNFLFGFALDFCSIVVGVSALVFGWNTFIVPVNFADGMTLAEGSGVTLLSFVFFCQNYDFAAKLDRMPGSERFSSTKKDMLISATRTLCFIGVLGVMHFSHWLSS